jgi:hypothetical protein
MTEPTVTRRLELEGVDAQLVRAKRAFGAAAAALTAGRLDGEARIREAVQAVEAARVELRRIADADEDSR